MSSNETAITVDNISKCFRIGLKNEIRDSFASTIFDFLKSPLKNYRKYRSLYKFDDLEIQHRDSLNQPLDLIWALKEVSFEVKKGEVLGVIGRNGAGKSTLLKILCKITTPTFGSAEIRGRVSSLLEVGTGFHHELTGRENIYLNGAVLGMTKKEVDHKFDEIVEFSEVEKFIDTPVKRYSTGMRVRLAFSVAAHLEPEILLIDEVLAVGDDRFQKKCLGKMDQVSMEGRTVLFVSHNMAAVARLCDRVILLEKGQVELNANPSSVISAYLAYGEAGSSTWSPSPPLPSDLDVRINRARILSHDNDPTSFVNPDKEFKVEIAYEVKKSVTDLTILCRLTDMQGNILWTSWDNDSPELRGYVREPGRYLSICKIPGNWLKPGRYFVSISAFIVHARLFSNHENVLAFDVSDVGYSLNMNRIGIITPILEWEVKRLNGSF